MDDTNMDLPARVAALEASVAALAAKVDAFQAIGYATPDDLKNHTEPLADAIATLTAQIRALPEPTSSEVASIAGDTERRNTWIDGILHKYFANEEPAAPPVVSNDPTVAG